jgi:hypothetical protein
MNAFWIPIDAAARTRKAARTVCAPPFISGRFAEWSERDITGQSSLTSSTHPGHDRQRLFDHCNGLRSPIMMGINSDTVG